MAESKDTAETLKQAAENQQSREEAEGEQRQTVFVSCFLQSFLFTFQMILLCQLKDNQLYLYYIEEIRLCQLSCRNTAVVFGSNFGGFPLLFLSFSGYL